MKLVRVEEFDAARRRAILGQALEPLAETGPEALGRALGSSRETPDSAPHLDRRLQACVGAR